MDTAFKGLGNGVQSDNDILCRQVCCIKALRALPSDYQGLSARAYRLKEKRRTTGLAIHRISRSKRWVAPQRCPIYATVILLSNFWMVIPFTLKYVHTLEKQDIQKLYYLYGSQYGMQYDPNSQNPEMLLVLVKYKDAIAGIAKAKADCKTM